MVDQEDGGKGDDVFEHEVDGGDVRCQCAAGSEKEMKGSSEAVVGGLQESRLA